MDELDEEIALLEAELLDAEIAEEEAVLLRMDQSDAVTANTNRDAVEYERPFEPTTGPIGFSRNDRNEFSNRPETGQENPDEYTLAGNAAANGVDPNVGLRKGLRASASLLDFDPKAQQAALEHGIRADLPDDFPKHERVLARDPASGMPAFLRELDDGSFKWALVNPPGGDVGDPMEWMGLLPTIVMETAGSVAGAIATGPATGGVATALGASAGASIGGALSIPLRVQLAKMAGIPQEVIDNVNITSEAGWQAMMSGGGEVLGHTIVGSVTGLRNFLGRPLDLNDIPALELEIKRRQKLISEAEKAGGVKYQPTLGELTGDTDIAMAEATLKSHAFGVASRKLKAADVNNEKASVEAMHNMATQEVRQPAQAGFRSGEEVSEATSQRLTRDRIDDPAAQADVAQREVDFFDEEYAASSNLEKYTALQGQAAKQQEELIRIEKEAWNLHRKTIEFDEVTHTANIGLDNSGKTPIRDYMNGLNNQANGALLETLAASNKATLKSAGFSKKQIAAIMDGEDPTGLAGNLLDTRQLHSALSELKRQKRIIHANPGASGFKEHDLDGLIGAIEKQMKEGTFKRQSSGRAVNPQKADHVRASFENANTQTELKHATFGSKAMRSLLKTRRVREDGRVGTRFDLPPAFVERRLLTAGDPRFMVEAMEAVGNDPMVRQGMAEEILKKMRRDTIRDGRVQQGLFNDFMDNYRGHMESVFSPEDLAKVNNLGSAGRVVDEMGLRAEQLARRLKNTYGRVVGDPTSPFSIAEEILGPRMTSKQATNLMNDLRRLDPPLAKQVEEKTMQAIFQKVSKTDQKVIDFTTLDALLIAKRDTLQAVGGRRYVADLDTLRNTLEILADKRGAKTVKDVAQTLFEKGTRLLFGPLGREQRFISAAAKSARQHQAGVGVALMENPNLLRQYTRLKNMSPRDPRFWVGANLLGPDILDIFTGLEPELYDKFLDGSLEKEMNQAKAL